MILHTLNKSRAHEDLNHQLSENISHADSVILIEDGAYQASSCAHNSIGHWANIAKQIYVLKEDAMARGIDIDSENVLFVDYKAFVGLALTHDKVISWF